MLVQHIRFDDWLADRRAQVDIIGFLNGVSPGERIAARQQSRRLRERANPQDRT